MASRRASGRIARGRDGDRQTGKEGGVGGASTLTFLLVKERCTMDDVLTPRCVCWYKWDMIKRSKFSSGLRPETGVSRASARAERNNCVRTCFLMSAKTLVSTT